jgi:hypothetical protein
MNRSDLDALSPESQRLVERMEQVLADARRIVALSHLIIIGRSWIPRAWWGLDDPGNPPDPATGANR